MISRVTQLSTCSNSRITFKLVIPTHPPFAYEYNRLATLRAARDVFAGEMSPAARRRLCAQTNPP